MSGFCTGAALASRGGASAAMKAGLVGGIILAVIEGLNIGITRMFSQMAHTITTVIQKALNVCFL